MITLNTIVKRFEDFADNHFFIRSFSFGGPEDVDLEKFDQYPLLHLIYTGATYEDTTKTLDFEVYIFDLPSAYEDKNERQKEVVSDAEQCAEDILADIANGQNIFIDSEDYEIANASVTPLQEANSNVLAGVLLELSITLPYDRSACDAPINGVQPEGGGFVYQRRGLLRVLTQNGTVDVLSVNTIKVTNGTLTDEGNGVVSIDTGGGGAENLDDLADVVITNPLDHDSLIYDEGTGDWINGAPKALDMPVHNGSGAIISKGALCKAIGTQGARVSVGLFDLDVDDPKILVGLATTQLAISGNGHVRTYGELRGITTDTYPVGTILYASGTAGTLSSTAGIPELAIATVTRSELNTGRLFIRSWTPNSGKAFRYITVGATTIEAEKQEDTLTLTAGTGISLTPDAGTDAVTIASTVTAPNTFGTIEVATQSSVVADSTTDTLTFAVAGGMAITTNATTDTITFDSARLDDDDVTLSGIREIDLNGENLNFTSSGFDILLVEADGVSMTDPVIRNYTGGTGGKITLAEATTNGGSSIAIKAPDSLAATTTYTLPSADGTSGQVLATNAAGGLSWTTRAANSFETIAVAGQSSIVADTHTDTLTIAAGSGITLTTDATTDTLTITNSGTANNTFSTIAVAGQSNVVADSASDTLTLTAGSNITLTTNATTDTITIAASGGAPAGSTGQVQYNSGGAFAAEAALYYDATNNRLSVGGNTSPTGTITSRGAGTTTGVAFRVEDSGGAEQFRIQDNGQTFLFEDSGVSTGSHSLILSGAKNEYWRPSISFRSSQISSSFNGFWAGDNSAMGIIAPGNNPVGGGLFFNGVTTSGSTAYYGVQFGGYQGSTAPTVANTLIFGAKWSGTGTTLTDLAAGEILFQCTNNATGRFYVFGGGGVGIRNSAPTNTNGLTIRGQGTTTALLFLAETSAGTARFTVRDDGAYAFAGGTVGAAQTGYTTFTNLTTDRTCNANATTVDELADILGTLIVDLKTKGIIAA